MNLASTLINSHQLWLPAQDHKVKPIKQHSMNGGEVPEAFPLAEKLLAADGFWGIANAPVDGTTTMHITGSTN